MSNHRAVIGATTATLLVVLCVTAIAVPLPAGATGTADSVPSSAATGATAVPAFEVRIEETNSPITESDRLTVTASVENTGGQNDTQAVRLSVGDTEVDATDVTLRGGSSTTVSLSWDTSPGDAGNHTATVASEDDADSRPLWVGAAPASVTIDDQQVADSTYQHLVVASAYPPAGGYVVLYNTSGSNASQVDRIIGVSEYLDVRRHRNVRIELETTLEAPQTIVAEVYNETTPRNPYQGFDAEEDEPYTHEGVPVRDSAAIRIATRTPADAPRYTRTVTFTPTSTPTPTVTPTSSRTYTSSPEADPPPPTSDPGTADDGAGVGPAVAVVALLCSSLLLWRRR